MLQCVGGWSYHYYISHWIWYVHFPSCINTTLPRCNLKYFPDVAVQGDINNEVGSGCLQRMQVGDENQCWSGLTCLYGYLKNPLSSFSLWPRAPLQLAILAVALQTRHAVNWRLPIIWYSYINHVKIAWSHKNEILRYVTTPKKYQFCLCIHICAGMHHYGRVVWCCTAASMGN